MLYTIRQIREIFENEVIAKLYKNNYVLYLQYYQFNLSSKRCIYIVPNSKPSVIAIEKSIKKMNLSQTYDKDYLYTNSNNFIFKKRRTSK